MADHRIVANIIPNSYTIKTLSKGQQILETLDVNDVVSAINQDDMSLKQFAASIPVSNVTLQSWLDSQLGYKYVAPRRTTVANPNQGKVAYPPLESLLSDIAINGYGKTARALGVNPKAIERHLRKSLSPMDFPLFSSGILDKYLV